MKDMIIGTISGISAVIAVSLLTPRPHPTPPPVRELAPADVRYGSELGQEYLPTTQPDPARVKLDHTIARVSVKELRFEKLITYLSDLTGLSFNVDWRHLESAGINADATVTLDLQGVPASVVLKAALADLGGGTIALGYRAANGVVKISTVDELSRETPTRIYNVRDIIEQAIAQGALDRPPAARSQARQQADDSALTEQEATDALARLIEESIDPVSWRDNGGTSGGIRAFAGRLIVTQTPENHEMILGLLAAFRRSESPPTTQGTAR